MNVFTSSELVSTLSSVSSSLSDNFLTMGSVSLIVAFVDIMTTMFTTEAVRTFWRDSIRSDYLSSNH